MVRAIIRSEMVSQILGIIYTRCHRLEGMPIVLAESSNDHADLRG